MLRGSQVRAALPYSVFESSAFGAVRLAATIEAYSDGEALRDARSLVPHGQGELRQGQRSVCRFGRTEPSFCKTRLPTRG